MVPKTAGLLDLEEIHLLIRATKNWIHEILGCPSQVTGEEKNKFEQKN